MADDTIPCPHCSLPLACARCGTYPTAEQLEDIAGKPLEGQPTGPASSSGRRPAVSDRTGPRQRAAYLAGFDQGPLPSVGDDWISRISQAERALQLTGEDLAQAVDALGEAQALAPDMADQRDLDPDARHRYVLLFQAEETWQRCIVADDAARTKLDRLTDQFNELTRPVTRAQFGEDGDGLGERPRR